MSVGAPVDHLSVTSASVASVHDPAQDIQYLKSFLPSVLFWNNYTEKVEEQAASQAAAVELLRSRLPEGYQPAPNSIELVNTMNVLVAALLALTDGKLVPPPADRTPSEVPVAVEVPDDEEVTQSPVILFSPQKGEEKEPETSGVGYGDALGLISAGGPDDLMKLDRDLRSTPSMRSGAPPGQPSSEPEPSLAGRSFSGGASELDASHRSTTTAGAPQPAQASDPEPTFDTIQGEVAPKLREAPADAPEDRLGSWANRTTSSSPEKSSPARSQQERRFSWDEKGLPEEPPPDEPKTQKPAPAEEPRAAEASACRASQKSAEPSGAGAAPPPPSSG